MGVYNRLKYLCPPLLNLPCSALMCQKRNQREEDHMDEKKAPRRGSGGEGHMYMRDQEFRGF